LGRPRKFLTGIPCMKACFCRTSVIMTLWPTHTSIHDITTKYPKPAELTTWLVIQKV
jgi:hypothetical protein